MGDSENNSTEIILNITSLPVNMMPSDCFKAPETYY
jgi:hypothetical protein